MSKEPENLPKTTTHSLPVAPGERGRLVWLWSYHAMR